MLIPKQHGKEGSSTPLYRRGSWDSMSSINWTENQNWDSGQSRGSWLHAALPSSEQKVLFIEHLLCTRHCARQLPICFSSSWLLSEEHLSPAPTPDLSMKRLSQAVRGRRKDSDAPPWTLKMQIEKGGWGGVQNPSAFFSFSLRS